MYIYYHQQNIFHTKMMLRELNLDNYLFGKKASDLSDTKQQELLRHLRREMKEIYNGKNIYE